MSNLFSEFKPTTASEWKAQVIKELKGEDFENLTWKNENGFDIQPFYTSEDLTQQYTPAFTHATWDICVKGSDPDATALNTQLLKHLNGGATSIAIHCEGLDLTEALKNIGLNFIQSVFYVDEKSFDPLKKFLEKHFNLSELNCSLFPAMLKNENDLEKWLAFTSAFQNYSGIKTWGIDALEFHNLNCLAYYEVAIILSALNEYLNKFTETKQKPTSALVVKAGVSSDYFIQIAKLRAIRRLWNILKAEYKITNDLYLIVETSLTNKSISDSYNNLLRTTVESMAAVLGGCNELIVTEFDTLFPIYKNLAGRMAINQQLILKDESYLDKMADVACGAYYIEYITDRIAGKALETIKRFENEGGYFKCLEKNIFQSEIASQARQKAAYFESGEQISIGVNKFRNEKEQIGISAASIEQLKHLSINNPVLNFELEHYFK